MTARVFNNSTRTQSERVKPNGLFLFVHALFGSALHREPSQQAKLCQPLDKRFDVMRNHQWLCGVAHDERIVRYDVSHSPGAGGDEPPAPILKLAPVYPLW